MNRPFSPLARLIVSLLVLPPIAVHPPCAMALPSGPQVVAGSVDYTQAGNQALLAQHTRNAIVNWQSFNIAPNELVRVLQSGADAAMLARVTGGDPSQLLGRLQADGKLFLINPKGVIVGPGAVIDTAAFMASTLDLADADFLKGGALTFKGDSGAGIVNLGKITAREGNVLLIAHTVKNAGEIAAPKGTAGLAAGTEVYLAAADAPSFVIKTNLTTTAEKTGVENTGVIAAAQAELKAAGGSIYDLAVNQSGFVRATGVERRDGRVVFTADGGNVSVTGATAARKADGSGGEILVGGDYRGGNAAVPNAARTYVGATARLDASATSSAGNGGRVIVWADEATRFQGTLEAKAGAQGGDGGFAEVSGRHQLDFSPAVSVDLSSPAGKRGTLLLDPDALVVGVAADSDTTTSGADPFVFGAAATPATLNVATLQDQLANSNVTLDTSTSAGDVTFDTDVAWSTDNTLRVNSGNNINLNASVTGGAASTLALYAGKAGFDTLQQGNDTQGRIEQSAASTIAVGTLTVGVNADADVPGNNGTQAGNATFDGTLTVGTLQVDLDAGRLANLVATNAANAIGTLRTTGTGGDLAQIDVANGAGNLDVELALDTSDAFEIKATTPGTLTLKSGSSFSFTGAVDVILASTGDAFVNEAGASPFGANARYLVYTSSPGATIRNGLTGAEVFNSTFGDTPPANFNGDTVSRFIFSSDGSLPFLNYAADNYSRNYGAANPTFTATVTGFQPGLADDVSGQPAFSTSATQSSGVGGYTINIARGTLLSSNYDFSFTPGALTIDAAPLIITADSFSRRVGLANPTLTASYNGLVPGETPAVVTGLALATGATMGSPVGDYTITASGATSPNYTISFEPGLLSITAAVALGITADNATRLYGDANPAFTATYSGFVGGDTASVVSGLQFSTAATQLSGVGAYTITPFGATAPGYNISYFSGTLTIDRAPLFVSVNDASRFYGDANPAFSANVSGLRNGDTAVAAGLSFSTTATALSNAGVTPSQTYPINAVAAATSGNYTVQSIAPGALTIKPAPLTVTFAEVARVYGDPNPVFDYTVSGMRNGQSAVEVVTVFNPRTTATERSPVANYTIFGDAIPANTNYTASVVFGNLSVTRRPLTISSDNKTRVYGDENPALTVTYTGLAPFDTPAIAPVTLRTDATVTSSVTSLGLPWGITFDRPFAANYDITTQFGQLTITPAPLSLGGLYELERVYGRADPAEPELFINGLKNSDTDASVGATFTFPAPTADAGDYTYFVTSRNPNYTFTAGATAPFTVKPAPLTVNLGAHARLYGTANPLSYNFTVAGLAFSDRAEEVVRIVNPTDGTTPVGRDQLDAVSLSRNYIVDRVLGGSFRINPRNVIVTIDNKARYWGDPDPDFTYGISGDGLASFENDAVLFQGFRTSSPTTQLTSSGYYRILPVFQPNPNYNVAFSTGWLAILPRPIEIEINPALAFGNDNIPPGFTTGGTGVDLVQLGGPGARQFTILATNLPKNVTAASLFAGTTFKIVSENEPSPVQVGQTLETVVFPERPAITLPRAATEPVAEPAGPGTVVFDRGTVQLITPTEAPFVFQYEMIVTLGNEFIFDPSPAQSAAQKTLEKFSDKKLFVIPSGLRINEGDYLVTKITNGTLTMKSDPDVVQRAIDLAVLTEQRKAARDAFDNLPAGQTAGAFNLPPELFPMLRELLGFAIDAEIKRYEEWLKGGSEGDDPRIGSIWEAMVDGDFSRKIFTGDQTQEDFFYFWLSDIHANTFKQAQLLPTLIEYAMNAAARPDDVRSPMDRALVAHMTPFVQAAQEEFSNTLREQRELWLEKQNSAEGATMYMLGMQDMFTDVVQASVEKVTKGAVTKMSIAVNNLLEDAKTTLAQLDSVVDDDLDTTLKVAVYGAGTASGLPAGAAATKLYLRTSKGFQGLKTKLNQLSDGIDVLKGVFKEIQEEVGGEISDKLANQASKQTFEKTAKYLDSDEMVKKLGSIYDDAYDAAIKAGESAADAKKLAQEALDEGIDKAVKEVGPKFMKEATEEMQVVAKKVISEGVEGGDALIKKAGKEAFDKILSEGGDEAMAKIAKETVEKKLKKELGEEALEKIIGKADDAGKKVFGELSEKFVKEVGEEALQEAGEKLAKKIAGEIGEEIIEKVSGKLVEKGVGVLTKASITGVKVGAKASSLAAKGLSMAKNLFFGPAAIIGLVVDIGMAAVEGAINRGVQEKQLQDMIDAGSNPVDVRAMQGSDDGKAVLMMGLMKMFSSDAMLTGTATTIHNTVGAAADALKGGGK